MFERSLDRAAYEVLRRYRFHALATRVLPLANHGGFSGARLWRVEGEGIDLCLRAWPTGDPSAQRLQWIHAFLDLARRGGIEFVPVLQCAEHDRTWVEYGGRLWELSTWMPGRADFHESPSISRLE